MFSKELSSQREKNVESRIEWVDQYRGYLALLFILSEIAWRYLPLTPTFLVHGFHFQDKFPQMMTLIDGGQSSFVLVMGFVGTISSYRQREKDVKKFPWRKFLIRLIFLFVLMVIIGPISFPEWRELDALWSWLHFRWIFFEGTFATIFWSYLISLIVLSITPEKPDWRVLIVIGIYITHSTLYTIPIIQNSEYIAWNTLNNIGTAIFGTCICDWWLYFKKDTATSNTHTGIKYRLIPTTILCYVVSYLINFLQPADNIDSTTSLALWSVGTGILYLFIFYSLDRIEIRIPFLTELGRNMIIMILLGAVFHYFLGIVDTAYLLSHPFIGVLWLGITPIVLCVSIAWGLSKLSFIIKF